MASQHNDAMRRGSDFAGKAPANGEDSTTGSDHQHDVTDEEDVAAEFLYRVLNGSLDGDQLPPLHSKIVRIFTSSTFTDMALERNALMENIYPRLKEFCRERYGLDFQAVDMRWGVRDEATDDHMTTELCMREIDNCQRLSMGPNFCLFLGQKYGYRPIPTVVLATEWELLHDVSSEMTQTASGSDDNRPEFPADAPSLLSKWYKKDDNAVPAVYILQPISSILPNFNNKRRQKLMEEAQTNWWAIMEKLQLTLRQAALCLFTRGHFNREQLHNYVMSGMAISGHSMCLCYDTLQIHRVQNRDLNLYRSVRNFIDMFGKNELDNEAIGLLDSLRNDLLPNRLPESNVRRFVVNWKSPDGLDVFSHDNYIRQFCERFYTVQSWKKSNPSSVTDLTSKKLGQEFKGHERVYLTGVERLLFALPEAWTKLGLILIMTQVRNYITGNSKCPFILHGDSGCGKTSLVARAYSQTRQWLDNGRTRTLTIVRFLGTSPDSSSIVPLLTNLCQHISLYHHLPLDTIPSDLIPLVNHFRKLIFQVSTPQTPLVIFLDSVDMLSSQDGAHRLAWLPVNMPPNCKMVVSVVQSHESLMERLHSLIEAADNFAEVGPLGPELAVDILKTWLSQAGRTVAPDQWNIVQAAIDRCSDALFVRLVFDEVALWRSYHKRHVTVLAPNIRASIHKLFERIETQHGKVLVSHAFSYVTASKEGITESELEDVLSLDEQVLNDVYQYHLPPVRRIPPLLWTRVRGDLSHYFTERAADGTTVIAWYHRQFADVSRERYLRNVNVHVTTHAQLADYFLGVWGGGVFKPFVYTELQRQRFFLDTTQGACDRKVPEQPLYFGEITRSHDTAVGRRSKTKSSASNQRRTRRLPNSPERSRHGSGDVASDPVDGGAAERLGSGSQKTRLASASSANMHDTTQRSASASRQSPQKMRVTSSLSQNEPLSNGGGTHQVAALGVLHRRRYNLRKLSELPFHLIRSRRIDQLLSEVLLNLRWLHAKLSCMPLHSLLADFEDAMTSSEDRDQSVDDPALRLIVEALRLSSSVLDKHPDMLAAQITGRLLPYYSTHTKIRELVTQGDSVDHGLPINAVVTATQYLNTPGGPLNYSLEGHPFAPFGLGVTSDGRYLVTASGVFIIWDLGTGDVFHRVTPPTSGGLVRHLVVTPDNKRAVAFTSNNELVVCSILTGEVKVISQVTPLDSDRYVLQTPAGDDVIATPDDVDELTSIRCTNNHLITWSSKCWFIYTLEGALVNSGEVARVDSPDAALLNADFCIDVDDVFLVTSSQTQESMTLQLVSRDSKKAKRLRLGNVAVLSRDKRTVFTTASDGTDGCDVICYVTVNVATEGWAPVTKATLANKDELYGLVLSTDERFLIGVTQTAFKRWHISTKRLVWLRLPAGTRNFPSKNCFHNVVVFTKNNQFIVAAIRKSIYVWDAQTGRFVKTLNAHFGRILSLVVVEAGDKANRVVSSSIDRSIKVFNIDNIRESMYAIDRLEKPIESVFVGGRLAMTPTRSTVGIWQIESGQLLKSLNSSGQRSVAIVTHAAVTSDGCYMITADLEHLLVWNIETGLVVESCNCIPNIIQLLIINDNSKFIVISRGTPKSPHTATCVCRHLLSCQPVYHFEYAVRQTLNVPDAVVSHDSVHLLLSSMKPPKQREERDSVPLDVLMVRRLDNGDLVCTSRPQYADYREYYRIVSMPTSANRVALLNHNEHHSVVIWDWKRKAVVRQVARWTGQLTADGRLGLYAPSRGGLDLIDLKTGDVVHTLIPRVAEGVFNIKTMFTSNSRHVVYYHSGKRSIRVFRVTDGVQISDFQCPVDIKDLADADGGLSLVLGAVDGSLIVLVIADPHYADGVELVARLPSRKLKIPEAGVKPKENDLYRALVVGRMLKKRTSKAPGEEGL